MWKRATLFANKKNQSRWSLTELSKTNTWYQDVRSLTTEESALVFLQRYAGPSLRTIYLRIISKDILIYLRHKCRHLKTISFLPKQNFSDIALEPINYSNELSRNFSSLIFIPQRIERLQLTLKGMTLKFAERISLSDDLLKILCKECNNLSRLQLDDFCLSASPRRLSSLTKRLCLTKLWLTDIHEDPRLLDDILSSAVEHLGDITSFCLSTTKSYIGDVSVFMHRCSTKWSKLQHVGIKGGILCPAEVFEEFTSNLPHITSLELEGSIITNSIIRIIATNLKMLTSLELTNGYYTAQGIKYMIGHQCLKTLALCQKHLTPSPLWLHAVYDVIASLPRIVSVKLVGNRLVELYQAEFYLLKFVNSDVKIQIQNSVLPLSNRKRRWSSAPRTVRVRHSRSLLQM